MDGCAFVAGWAKSLEDAIVGHGVDNVGTRGFQGGRHCGVADCCWLRPYEADLEVVIAPCRRVGDKCQQQFSKVSNEKINALSLGQETGIPCCA